jgi:hypothetical protein
VDFLNRIFDVLVEAVGFAVSTPHYMAEAEELEHDGHRYKLVAKVGPLMIQVGPHSPSEPL